MTKEEITQLFESEYKSKLFCFLLSKLPTRQDAEDVLQEVFMSLVKTTYRGECSIESWCYTVARGKIIDFLRKHKIKHEELGSISVNPDLDNTGFWEVFNQLPDNYRNVLSMRYVEGLGVSEMAIKTGRSYKAIESGISHAKVKAKGLFSTWLK